MLCLLDHRTVHCCSHPALPWTLIELPRGPYPSPESCSQHPAHVCHSPPNWQTSANGSAPELQERLGKQEARIFNFCNNKLALPSTRSGKSSKYRKRVQIWSTKDTLVATPVQCNPPWASIRVQEGHGQNTEKYPLTLITYHVSVTLLRVCCGSSRPLGTL